MKKHKFILHFIIAILLCLTVPLHAQDDCKDWSEGALEWSDFQHNNDSASITNFRCNIGFKGEAHVVNDTVVARSKAYCKMKLQECWVNPSFMNEAYLKYNQVMFDIGELYSRKMQYRLDRIRYPETKKTIFEDVMDQCDRCLDEYEKESDQGRNIEAVDQWDIIIGNQLNDMPEVSRPAFKKRNFSMGMFAGMGFSTYEAGLTGCFEPGLNLVYGFDFGFKKWTMILSASLSESKLKEPVSIRESWEKDHVLNTAIIDASFGYTFRSGHKLRITPYVGYGVLEVSQRLSKKNGEPALLDYHMKGGLAVDYKLKTTLALIPYRLVYKNEIMDSFLRLNIGVEKARFSDALEGYVLNITLGLHGVGSFIKVLK